MILFFLFEIGKDDIILHLMLVRSKEQSSSCCDPTVIQRKEEKDLVKKDPPAGQIHSLLPHSPGI
jgi:hypothetical protein